MLSSDLNKLAASYAQIASEAIDPKGAARMDAAKGKTKETEDETNKRLMLGKYSPGAKNKKVDKCTSESFYLKRLQAMNPVFAEQYLAIAEILIEEGYENSRLIDNIIEAFPPEMVGYEFISALKAVNPRLHENTQSTEKRQAKAIVMHFSEGPELRKLGTAIKNLFTRKNTPSKTTKTIPAKDRPADMQKGKVYGDASPAPTPATDERSAAANDAKQQAAKAAANKTTPSPTPKAKPAASTGAAKGPITSKAAIAGGSKEGQGPKSAASTYTGANDKTKVGRYKTLAQHRAAVAANKNSMSEGSVFESLKKARENVGASTCWDGYKAKGTKKKDGKEVPNCVKEEEIVEGIRDKDSEKGTKERKERLEKKRGMKVDDHPEYLEKDMKKRQENNEKARKDLAKGPQMKNPHFEDVSHYDVILAFLSENNLIESVEEAEEIMMQLTGAQIVEIIEGFMNEESDLVEGPALQNTIKTLETKRDKMDKMRPGSSNSGNKGQSVGAALYKAHQRGRV